MIIIIEDIPHPYSSDRIDMDRKSLFLYVHYFTSRRRSSIYIKYHKVRDHNCYDAAITYVNSFPMSNVVHSTSLCNAPQPFARTHQPEPTTLIVIQVLKKIFLIFLNQNGFYYSDAFQAAGFPCMYTAGGIIRVAASSTSKENQVDKRPQLPSKPIHGKNAGDCRHLSRRRRLHCRVGNVWN